MRARRPVPITLMIARNHPLGETPGPSREVARHLTERGERVEVIAESPDEEEFVQLDPDGVLVHRVCPARAYAGKLARPLRKSRTLSFALRAAEKAWELEHLWNRAIARVEVAGEPSEASFLGLTPVRHGLLSEPMRAWPACHSVSLICPTYNRVDELVDTLRSLRADLAEAQADGIDAEAVVVFQNEGTPEKVLARAPELKEARIRWVRSEPGLPRARNVGLRHSHGELLVFVDDDVVLDPGFIRTHLTAANACPTAAGSAGRVRSRILGERGATNRAVGQLRLSAFVDTHFDSLTDAAVVPHTPVGANMAFKRAAMTALFGDAWFDERLEGSAHREETTLCVELFRRGGHLIFARDASLLHLEAEAGGCENRGRRALKKDIEHLSLDYLFFDRFFRDLGPLGPLGALPFFAREVRLAKGQRLRTAYANAAGLWRGWVRRRREDTEA
jgi:GT2 family glycosyltransferase